MGCCLYTLTVATHLRCALLNDFLPRLIAPKMFTALQMTARANVETSISNFKLIYKNRIYVPCIFYNFFAATFVSVTQLTP